MKRVGIDISRDKFTELPLCKELAEEVSGILERRGIQAIIYDCVSEPEYFDRRQAYIEKIKQMNKDKLSCSISLHLGVSERPVTVPNTFQDLVRIAHQFKNYDYYGDELEDAVRPCVIHVANEEVRGAFCYYFSTKGSRLAQNIADKLCPILPGREKQTLHNPDLTILLRTNHPCCVVFAGFMTSPDDMDVFHRRMEDIAFAIADGIGKFLNNK